MWHRVPSKLPWSRCQQTSSNLWKEMQTYCRQILNVSLTLAPALRNACWVRYGLCWLKGHLNLNWLLRLALINSFSLCLRSVVIGHSFFRWPVVSTARTASPWAFELTAALLLFSCLPCLLNWPPHCFSSLVCPTLDHPGHWSGGYSSTDLHLSASLSLFFSMKTVVHWPAPALLLSPFSFPWKQKTNKWIRNNLLKCKTCDIAQL